MPMTVREQLAASSRDDGRIRPIPAVLVGLVLVFAFLLRFDAAVGRYGTAPGMPLSEHGQQALQALAGHLRPAQVGWASVERPYVGGDPIAYLRKARAMESFYAPDTREPLYVASVKLGLWLFHDRNIGITYTSLTFSLLLVWATYLLGAYALCRWVGLAAAFLIAGEFEIIRWSVEGWRDDAFSFFFILSAYALLRLAAEPRTASGLGAGVAAGLVTLTRITSLSFLAPGFGLALFPWLCGRLAPPGATGPAFTARLRVVVVAGLVMLVLVGPFLLNCWLEYGDPLYSINFATRFYRQRAGLDAGESMDVGAYLSMRAHSHPVAFADTTLNGFTTYPFENKWRGMAVWSPLLPGLLARLALLGLALFLWSAAGRYLLVMGLASMAPYAFTWRIVGGAEWRLTMHMYPIYALAAFWAVDRAARFAHRLSQEDFRVDPFEQRALLRRALVTLLAAAALAWSLRELPHQTRLEDLHGGRAAHIRAGEGDSRYFVVGWYPPVAGPNVTARYNRTDNSMIRVPMIAGRRHTLTLRLQPYHEPAAEPPAVVVTLNGEPLAELTLGWDPTRIGSYEVEVPAQLVRGGMNELGLHSPARFRASIESGNPFVVDGQQVGFFIWYVNVTAADSEAS